MDWLAIGSAAAGAIGSIWSSNSANSLNRDMFNQQMAYNKEVMQNRHQWEVQDLKAAGLNPLLSTTSPTGTLSAPSAPRAEKPDFSQSALALGQMRIADKQAEAQLANAQSAKLNAQANAANADTLSKRLAFDTGPAFALQEKSFGLQEKLAESSIQSAQAHIALENAQTMRQKIENVYLPDIMELNLSEQQQRIALAVANTVSEIEYRKAMGQSAISNSESNAIMARNAERVGVSQSALNAGNLRQVNEKVKDMRYRNQWQHSSDWFDFSNYFGQVIGNFIPLLRSFP